VSNLSRSIHELRRMQTNMLAENFALQVAEGQSFISSIPLVGEPIASGEPLGEADITDPNAMRAAIAAAQKKARQRRMELQTGTIPSAPEAPPASDTSVFGDSFYTPDDSRSAPSDYSSVSLPITGHAGGGGAIEVVFNDNVHLMQLADAIRGGMPVPEHVRKAVAKASIEQNRKTPSITGAPYQGIAVDVPYTNVTESQNHIQPPEEFKWESVGVGVMKTQLPNQDVVYWAASGTIAEDAFHILHLLEDSETENVKTLAYVGADMGQGFAVQIPKGFAAPLPKSR
jgi:hypothetical protein